MSALLTMIARLVRSVWRYRWSFLVPVATLLLPATIYALRMPDEFEAKAVVHVKPLNEGSINRALPQETATRADEIMATVRDRIFTRDNLEVVRPILAPDAAAHDPTVLEDMAKAYDWDQVGRSAFTLALTKSDGLVAAEGVNRILDAFLEAERAVRLRRAEHSLTFQETELEEARKSEQKARAILKAFRAEHMDTLPDREDVIRTQLMAVRAEVSTQAAQVQTHRLRVEALDERLLLLATTSAPTTARPTSATEDMLRTRLSAETGALNALQQSLNDAEARYTPRHPDVIRLRSAVAVQRKNIQETTGELEKVLVQSRQAVAESGSAQLARDRKQLEIFKRVSQTALEGAARIRDQKQAEAESLTTKLAEMPATKRALQPLLDELEQAKEQTQANQLAARSARLTVAFYRNRNLADVTDFEITARAVPPVRATGPGRWKVIATALGLGLLIGYGLVLLRARVEGSTVTSAEDLVGLFPAAIVVNVPLLGNNRRRTWGWRFKELGLAVYVVVLLGASTYLLAAQRGMVPKPTWWVGIFGDSA